MLTLGTTTRASETRGAAVGAETPVVASRAPPPVLKKVHALGGALRRLEQDVADGAVTPGSEALRRRVVALLRLEARVAGALPRTLGVPFALLSGRLTTIEESLESAREAALSSQTSASIRASLLPARAEARRLARKLRPRGSGPPAASARWRRGSGR